MHFSFIKLTQAHKGSLKLFFAHSFLLDLFEVLLDLDFLFFFFLLLDVEESEDVREDDLDRRDFLDFFFDLPPELLLDLRLDFFFDRLSDLLLDRPDLLRDLLLDLLDLLLLRLLDLWDLLLLLDLLRDLLDFFLLAERLFDLRDFFLWLRLLLLPFFSLDPDLLWCLLLLLDLDRDCFFFLDSFSLSGGEGDLLDFASLPPDPFRSLLLPRLSLELSLELPPPPRTSLDPPLFAPLAGLGEESLLPDFFSFPPPLNHFFSLSL